MLTAFLARRCLQNLWDLSRAVHRILLQKSQSIRRPPEEPDGKVLRVLMISFDDSWSSEKRHFLYIQPLVCDLAERVGVWFWVLRTCQCCYVPTSLLNTTNEQPPEISWLDHAGNYRREHRIMFSPRWMTLLTAGVVFADGVSMQLIRFLKIALAKFLFESRLVSLSNTVGAKCRKAVPSVQLRRFYHNSAENIW